jgi:hypothetical protein
MAASFVNTRIKIANYGPERKSRRIAASPAVVGDRWAGFKMTCVSPMHNLSPRYRFQQWNSKFITQGLKRALQNCVNLSALGWPSS